MGQDLRTTKVLRRWRDIETDDDEATTIRKPFPLPADIRDTVEKRTKSCARRSTKPSQARPKHELQNLKHEKDTAAKLFFVLVFKMTVTKAVDNFSAVTATLNGHNRPAERRCSFVACAPIPINFKFDPIYLKYLICFFLLLLIDLICVHGLTADS
jgi:hypothetical protein